MPQKSPPRIIKRHTFCPKWGREKSYWQKSKNLRNKDIAAVGKAFRWLWGACAGLCVVADDEIAIGAWIFCYADRYHRIVPRQLCRDPDYGHFVKFHHDRPTEVVISRPHGIHVTCVFSGCLHPVLRLHQERLGPLISATLITCGSHPFCWCLPFSAPFLRTRQWQGSGNNSRLCRCAGSDILLR